VRGEVRNDQPRSEGEHRTPEQRAAVERLQTPEGLREEQSRSERLMNAQRRFGRLRGDVSRGNPNW
jgi:hypothetical protein